MSFLSTLYGGAAMIHVIFRRLIPAIVCLSLFFILLPIAARSAEDNLDICRQATAEQLAALSRKPLYPTAETNGCFWSEKPGAMADLDIRILETDQPLRSYFNKNLSPSVKLVKITDLGDEGLMSVSEGSLGVVVIRKGNKVLQSAATFLDIEPGSKKQTALWSIYRRILKQL